MSVIDSATTQVTISALELVSRSSTEFGLWSSILSAFSLRFFDPDVIVSSTITLVISLLFWTSCPVQLEND